MRRVGRQCGEGKGSVIFWLLVLGIGALVGKQVVPMKIAKMELKDYAEELCQLEPRATADQFRKALFARAKDLDLPIQPKQISVEKDLRRAKIDIQYSYTIDLLVTDYEMSERIYIDRDLFLM